MTKPLLDATLVGPENDEYDRIERANETTNKALGQLMKPKGFKLQWSWGDSNRWRVIVGIPAREDCARFLYTDENVGLAQEIVQIISDEISLAGGFKLYLEADSDERVNSNEGWFNRINAAFSDEYIFVWNGRELSRAPNQ